MQCFDCATDDQRERTAAAVCPTCGAGLCVGHAVPGFAEEVHNSLGNPVTRRLPGRRLYCRDCAPATAVAPEPARAAALV